MLGRLPYEVVYRVFPNVVLVVAIAHYRSRPRYWRERWVLADKGLQQTKTSLRSAFAAEPDMSIGNDPSRSNSGFGSLSDLSDVNEPADELGGSRRLIMLIFADRLRRLQGHGFVESCLALGSRFGTAQGLRGSSTVGRLDR